MMEPIKPGDDLFPLEFYDEDGCQRARRKSSWTREKQISLNLRTIDYQMQFPGRHRGVGLASMIDAYYAADYEESNSDQRIRYDALLAIRKGWI